MCFNGGFALAMMTEPAVVAPALAQPSRVWKRYAAVAAAFLGGLPLGLAFLAGNVSALGFRPNPAAFARSERRAA